MIRTGCTRSRILISMIACLSAASAGCRPSDILSVPLPSGTIGSGSVQSASGAETAFSGSKALFEYSVTGILELTTWTGLLSDEFTFTEFTYAASNANIDARRTAGFGGFGEYGDQPLSLLLNARSDLLVVIPSLEKYESGAARSSIGEAYALIGYAEIFLAEDYCAGVPLDQVLPSGGVQYNAPLTTDSLLGVAEAHLDSGIAEAAGDATVLNFARVGLGRAHLDRGDFAGAAAAVTDVPTAFVYNAELEPTQNGGTSSGVNLYAGEIVYGCSIMNVADREGGNGLNFVSANDPRLAIDSTTEQTCDGGVMRYPLKFGLSNVSTVPVATGLEARLIQAEASLNARQVPQWASELNALRSDTGDTHVGGLPAIGQDSTSQATSSQQVDLMFRERAFWLFGLGTRLGDMRRLIRQYGRSANQVFPVGPYTAGNGFTLPSPLPTFGTDVALTLPTGQNGTTPNPYYHGCTSTGA